MTATMTDGAALLRGIIDEPDDDLVRLIYADWLEENGDVDRADFIRVSVACPESSAASNTDWLCDPGLTKLLSLWLSIGNRGKLPHVSRATFFGLPDGWASWMGSPGIERQPPVVLIHRGFASSVRLPLAAWRKHGPALAKAQPITGVELSDREPQNYHNNAPHLNAGPLFGWRRTAEPMAENCSRYDLPPPLWAFVLKQPGAMEHGMWADFNTLDEANKAISPACLAWARDQTP